MIEAVADRLEGAPRQLRRRWSEFKAQVVAEALEPGASVSAIAHRIGILPSRPFAWRRDARVGRRAPSRLSGSEAAVVQAGGRGGRGRHWRHCHARRRGRRRGALAAGDSERCGRHDPLRREGVPG
nr:transposase [Sinorhizobium sp. 7-81]